LIIEKDEQERLAWKFQEEVDSLTEQRDLEHKARVDAEKVVKQLNSELQDVKQAATDATRNKSRADQLARELAAEIEEVKDRLDEEEDRARELQNFKKN